MRVITFIGASEIFPKLKAAIPLMKSYKEVADQKAHSLSLYNERIDAIFSDGYIVSRYNYLIKKENKNEIYNKKVQFKLISEPTKFHMFFKNQAMAQKFNGCLKQKSIKLSIDSIINQFLINQMINN